MTTVTIICDAADLAEHHQRAFKRLIAAEAAYPDSYSLKRLHVALDGLQACLTGGSGGVIQPLSGGGKSDPPPPGP